jgi:hypothetical protein
MTPHSRAPTAGVREAPRHEIAGGGASSVRPVAYSAHNRNVLVRFFDLSHHLTPKWRLAISASG